jgi:hypothetical protein
MVGRILLLALAVASAAGSLPAHAVSLGTYEIVTLGLTDAAHTRSDGYQASFADLLNGSGLAAGYSESFSGADPLGESTWVYDSATASTTRVGFLDATHTRSDGYQLSSVEFLNESSLAAGYSERFSGADPLGQSAWVYDSPTATTTRIGFFDAAHTRSDGYQFSHIWRLNDSGLAVGNSQRFDGGSSMGSSAWLYDSSGASTTRIGFLDATHTRSDGYQNSDATGLNESGFAAGVSERFDGASALGYSAWLYDSAGATTTRVGLFDAAHTRSDGYQLSLVGAPNESGLAVGYSDRFDAGSFMGHSLWLYDAADQTTTRVGLFDAEHTRSDGYQSSQVEGLTESGLVAGQSDRFGGGSDLGRSAWVYDSAAATMTRAGFFDATHTRSDGYQYSNFNGLNESGLAVGYSWRFGGGSDLGTSAWLYDDTDATTTRIGLFDAAHTRSDGYQLSIGHLLNEAGLVGGYSGRFDGATSLGLTAWIYDTATASQYTIVLSTRSDGYAYSALSFLGEDGLALGSYELFDSLDNYLGMRAFAWTAGDGAVDLGGLVNGGLSAEGWSHLEESIRANGLGQILGYGQLASGSELAYLLVPVPEPRMLLLLTVGLGGLALQRRRSNPGRG